MLKFVRLNNVTETTLGEKLQQKGKKNTEVTRIRVGCW